MLSDASVATLADAAGVSPRVVQRMMRHSNLELTGRYTRPRRHDIEGAVADLPTLRPEAAEPLPMAATGTDGQRISEVLAHDLPTGGDGTGRVLTDADAITPTENPPLMRRNPLDLSGLDASGRVLTGPVVSSGDETRTRDLRVMNPPL